MPGIERFIFKPPHNLLIVKSLKCPLTITVGEMQMVIALICS